MGDSGALEAVGVEIRSLRDELAALRAEQRQMARSIDELTQTFRSLATHMGIAAEPYQKASRTGRDNDPPGFA